MSFVGISEKDTLALAEIDASRVTAVFEDWGSAYTVSLTLPYGCRYGGLLTRNPYTGVLAQLDRGGLYIPENLRKNGLGERLVSSLAYLALSLGITDSIGPVESQHAVKIHSRLFGADNIYFSDTDPVTSDYLDLPFSVDQIIASLERAECHEVDVECRKVGLDMYVDLSGVDLERLEKPDIQNPIVP